MIIPESVVKTHRKFDFPLILRTFYLVWRSDFNFTVCYVEVSMRRSPRNVKIAFSHAGLTHYGGILFFNEFSRMLQLRRRFLTRHLRYPRCNDPSDS